jgi:hypothetical protein
MKTADLTGATLDYWCARAEGIPAADLEIRQVPRTVNRICVRILRGREGVLGVALEVLAYSTNWAQGGPLLESRAVDVSPMAGVWYAKLRLSRADGVGDTVLQAVCRAVVHQAYGDNVEDRPC